MTPRAVTKGSHGWEANFAFRHWLKSAGIPNPIAEHRFHPKRRWRFDYAWPDRKVALEVEGGVWSGGRHTRGKGFLGDVEKYNAAVLLGWRVLRCTPQTLCDPETIQAVRQLLGARVEITVEAM